MFKKLYKLLNSHGAAVLAVSAIFLAAWEGYENRNHNRLSVLPHIGTLNSFNGREQSYELNLSSTGLGPAVITGFYTFVDGKLAYPVENSSPWNDAKSFLRSNGLKVTADASVGAGQFIPPGDSKNLLKVSRVDESVKLEDWRESISKLGVLVCYCSVYGGNCAGVKTGSVNLEFLKQKDIVEQCKAL